MQYTHTIRTHVIHVVPRDNGFFHDFFLEQQTQMKCRKSLNTQPKVCWSSGNEKKKCERKNKWKSAIAQSFPYHIT